MELGRVVYELVHRQGDKVDEHDLDDGAQSRKRRASGKSHNGYFTDGRIHHAVFAEGLCESFGHTEGPTQRNVLAEEINPSIAVHLFVQAGADGFQISLFGHIPPILTLILSQNERAE